MTTVDSWPKTFPMLSAWSWNSTTETHLVNILLIKLIPWPKVCKKTKGKIDTNKLQDLVHRYVWHLSEVKNYQKLHEELMKRIWIEQIGANKFQWNQKWKRILCIHLTDFRRSKNLANQSQEDFFSWNVVRKVSL